MTWNLADFILLSSFLFYLSTLSYQSRRLLAPRIHPLAVDVHDAVAFNDPRERPEPLGLGEGSSNVSAMDVACTVVGPVTVGCSRVGSTVILRSLYFLSFL